MKEKVGQAIAQRVRDGETIGVGTGTTVDAALAAIGERVAREGLRISVVPSSYQSAWSCQELGLTVLHPASVGRISWGFDGADQINKDRWAIKGKGGAMLQEKLIAKQCEKFIVIVDQSKVVSHLGAGCAIPVEVLPEGITLATAGLQSLGASEVVLRPGSGKHGPTITEKGNVIVDAVFPRIESSLEREIKSIAGIVESGLFIGYISEVLVGDAQGVTSF